MKTSAKCSLGLDGFTLTAFKLNPRSFPEWERRGSKTLEGGEKTTQGSDRNLGSRFPGSVSARASGSGMSAWCHLGPVSVKIPLPFPFLFFL